MKFIIKSIFYLALLCNSGGSAFASILSSWDTLSQGVFSLVNTQRSLHGFTPLIADSRLQNAALSHSTDMANNNYFSHTGLDLSTPFTRISNAGYNWTQAGENIAAGYSTPVSVMFGTDNLLTISNFDKNQLGGSGFASFDEVGKNWTDANWDAWTVFNGDDGGWMGSSLHRADILNTGFTDIGISAVFNRNSEYGYYWTQDFGAGDTAPVPIPSAAFLFSGAVLSLVGFRRKKVGLPA